MSPAGSSLWDGRTEHAFVSCVAGSRTLLSIATPNCGRDCPVPKLAGRTIQSCSFRSALGASRSPECSKHRAPQALCGNSGMRQFGMGLPVPPGCLWGPAYVCAASGPRTEQELICRDVSGKTDATDATLSLAAPVLQVPAKARSGHLPYHGPLGSFHCLREQGACHRSSAHQQPQKS